MNDQLFFASVMTTLPDVDEATAELIELVNNQMGERSVDLAIVFFTAHFTYQARQIAGMLLAELEPRKLLGCTAEGVIGREREIEGDAAITLIAANLAETSLTPVILQPTDWPLMLLDADKFYQAVGAPDGTRLIIALGDPFSTPMADVLQSFNAFYPGIPIAGGMASGVLRPNGNALILDDRVTHAGAVGVAIGGELDVDVIVSQGCKPIWRPFKIQSARKNVIFNLEGQPPLAWLEELIPELGKEDKVLLDKGLLVGRAIHSTQESLGRGDFLIRGVIGADPRSGAIEVADLVEEGETIQFHLRDAQTAEEDLEMMLIPQMFREPPQGALLFSCNGRGTRLYDHPDGDISIIRRSLGELPLAGFFCAGEIGPVGGRNFLHGHTASLVFFRSPSK